MITVRYLQHGWSVYLSICPSTCRHISVSLTTVPSTVTQPHPCPAHSLCIPGTGPVPSTPQAFSPDEWREHQGCLLCLVPTEPPAFRLLALGTHAIGPCISSGHHPCVQAGQPPGEPESGRCWVAGPRDPSALLQTPSLWLPWGSAPWPSRPPHHTLCSLMARPLLSSGLAPKAPVTGCMPGDPSDPLCKRECLLLCSNSLP